MDAAGQGRARQEGLERRAATGGWSRGAWSSSASATGNPKEIRDWADLARPGVGVLYPDPKTSGGARWNINAIYGAGLLGDGEGQARPRRPPATCWRGSRPTSSTWTPRAGRAWRPSSAGPATRSSPTRTSCSSARSSGRSRSPTSRPPPTLLIESPAAMVDASVERHGNREVAEAFLAFLRSDEGQAILAEYGFRPVDPSSTVAGPAAPAAAAVHDGATSAAGRRSRRRSSTPGGVWASIFTRRARGGSERRWPRSAASSPRAWLLRASTLAYLGVMVVLPLAALAIQAAEPGAVGVLEGDRRPVRLARPEADVRDGPGRWSRSTP